MSNIYEGGYTDVGKGTIPRNANIYLDPSMFPRDVGAGVEISAARAMTHEIGQSLYALIPGLLQKAKEGLWGNTTSAAYQYETFPMAFETRIWEGLGGKPRKSYTGTVGWNHGKKYVYEVPFY